MRLRLRRTTLVESAPMRICSRAFVVCFLLATPPHLCAQTRADPRLLRQISQIRVIDNHSHCEAVLPSRGEKWDGANPLGTPPYPAVVRLRVDNPEWIRAWRRLYGYTHWDMAPEHVRALFG